MNDTSSKKDKKQTRKDVKESLIKQLEAKNAYVAHFISMIDDYLALFELSESLKKDLKKNGTTITYTTSTGVERKRENPAVKNFISVNKQMISILSNMGLTTDKPTGESNLDNTGL